MHPKYVVLHRINNKNEVFYLHYDNLNLSINETIERSAISSLNLTDWHWFCKYTVKVKLTQRRYVKAFGRVFLRSV